MIWWIFVVLSVIMFLVFLLLSSAAPAAEERAVAYLAREVPRWSRENHCFSCHNNGDAARALYAARRLSYRVADEALADTTAWLRKPLDWDNNKGDPAFSDKKLARIQFAAALADAVEDEKNLRDAAESLLPSQEPDGSWQVDAESSVGSPVTYGPTLATYMARRTLEKAGASRYREAIERADRWLLEAKVSSTPDAAATVLALRDRAGSQAKLKTRQTLDLLIRGQASDGGWGPHAHSPSEPFDTAMVLLALASVEATPETRRLIEQGRAYLLRTQLPPGGWPETTRPAGAQSYAQHISTSGWATLALLETRAAVQ